MAEIKENTIENNNSMRTLIMQPVLNDPDDTSLSFIPDAPKTKLVPKVENIVVMPRAEEYDTGDILLFSDKSFIPSRLIEYFTDSKYSHAGIILRNPSFLDAKLPDGLYLFESTGLTDIVDAEDNTLKTGVQIRRLEDVYKEYNGAVFWRKLTVTRDEKFYKTLNDIHKSVYNKPYDTNPKDWIESLLDVKLGDVQLTSRFFCSAMVTYVYAELGLVESDIPWTIIRPKDLGTENVKTNRVSFKNCHLGNEFLIKGYDSYVHYVYRTF